MFFTKKDYWKRAEKISVDVAIGLICDFDDPTDLPFDLPDSYEAISYAISTDIYTGKLKAA